MMIKTLNLLKNNALFSHIINFKPLIINRTFKSELKIKWVRPEKRPFFYPIKDLEPIHEVDKTRLKDGFEKSLELKTASKDVRRIFEIEINSKRSHFTAYCNDLCDRVRRHQYDRSSHEVLIARLTAQIRWLQNELKLYPRNSKNKSKLNLLIHRRGKQLRYLRLWDYPRFEWLLEKLDIEYRPHPDVYERVERKKSLKHLTTIHCEELKEKKIAAYRQKLDDEKIPFMMRKLEKLKWIHEQEQKFKLEPSVTEEDIQQCAKQLEEVKINVDNAKRQKRTRVIHPWTLELYDPLEIKEAEGKSKNDDKPTN